MQEIYMFMQHHWALSLALLIVLFVLVNLELFRLKKNAAALTPAAATRLINRQDAVLLDTRSADAYQAGHIVGAISLPLTDQTVKKVKLDKYKNQPIILACTNGNDSARLANQLKENGYNAHVLGGGIQAWRNADLPIIKG